MRRHSAPLAPQDVREDQPVQPEDSLRALDVADRPFLVGEPIPAVCTIRDVARVLRVSLATAYRRQAAGHLKHFELATFGGHQRYSGTLLAAWQERSTQRHVNGDLQRPRVFGRASGR